MSYEDAIDYLEQLDLDDGELPSERTQRQLFAALFERDPDWLDEQDGLLHICLAALED